MKAKRFAYWWSSVSAVLALETRHARLVARSDCLMHVSPADLPPDEPDGGLDSVDVLDNEDDDPGETGSLVIAPSFGWLAARTIGAVLALLALVAGANALSPPPREPPRVPCEPLVAAVSYGEKGCSRGRPCGLGGSDCDSDDACLSPLLCFKREQGEAVPGVNVSALPSHYDVCFDPMCEEPDAPLVVDADLSISTSNLSHPHAHDAWHHQKRRDDTVSHTIATALYCVRGASSLARYAQPHERR